MVGGGVGVVVVASPVAMVRWVAIMGMRERERKKKNKKETKGWPEQEKPPQVALLAVI